MFYEVYMLQHNLITIHQACQLPIGAHIGLSGSAACWVRAPFTPTALLTRQGIFGCPSPAQVGGEA